MNRKKGEADAEDEKSYKIFVNQAQYEMLTGSINVAIGYLDTAVGMKPEDDLPYIVRSKCLCR